ncbi:MAG: hypothetical protein P8166_02870 [Candidatus Thiodiazotropha sp.]|jgi:hypothetical protein
MKERINFDVESAIQALRQDKDLTLHLFSPLSISRIVVRYVNGGTSPKYANRALLCMVFLTKLLIHCSAKTLLLSGYKPELNPAPVLGRDSQYA